MRRVSSNDPTYAKEQEEACFSRHAEDATDCTPIQPEAIVQLCAEDARTQSNSMLVSRLWDFCFSGILAVGKYENKKPADRPVFADAPSPWERLG